MLSERVERISDSPTLAVSAKAKEMKSMGINVIDFGAGQPDFPPPEHVKQAAIDAVRANDSRYTPAAGFPELKQAVCEKLRKDNGIGYGPENVIISAGAKHALYNIFQAILNPGDEVIIPRPYWVSYPDMVRLADGVPVFAETDQDFRLKADSVLERLSDKTKAIVLNSPNNPSGAVFPESGVRRVAKEAAERRVLIISDEIYEKIIYEREHLSPASISEEVKSVTLTVNGLSKSHAIPGWRLGYAAGPEDIIKAMGRLQSQSTSNPSSIVQRAAIAALKERLASEGIVEEYRKRRDLLVEGLNSIEGFSCTRPGGAFYVFPRIPVEDDVRFSQELLEKEHVAIVPGSAFGMPGHVRISYATSMKQIGKGLERIQAFTAG
ncbi:MAG: pyridoxal phosphate-dependent aminotransferase [Candidatus Aenigmarchaeota archaeon]|nr:pyridoxal phosphate-dependent aminotransferase [Candidatus Aenigmarchaeota archaeon]